MKYLFLLPLFLLIFGISLNAASSPVVINEFMAANSSTVTDENGEYDDWIELYNTTAQIVDIGECYLTDSKKDNKKWMIPKGTKIEPHGFLVFWADGQPEQGPLHTSYKLSKDGEHVCLFANNGAILDTVTFGPQTTDVSYGRNPDGSSNWTTFSNATPGRSNTQSVILPKVVINEIMASNTKIITDENGIYEDWVELYNNSDTEADISGFFLTDTIGKKNKWKFPANTKIQPHGFLLVWCDNEPEDGPYHASFKLSKSGEFIGLYARDEVSVLDTVTFGSQEDDISYGRKSDGDLEWVLFQTPTPGKTNTISDVPGQPAAGMVDIILYPNPVTNFLDISLDPPTPSLVSIFVYNIKGELVDKIIPPGIISGKTSMRWYPSSLCNGSYFFTIFLNGKLYDTRQVLVIK